MGEAQFHILIQLIQILASFKRQLLAVVDRLAAASYAATGTGHDLYEVIVHFPRLDLVKKGPRVAKSADYCSPDLNVVDGEFS